MYWWGAYYEPKKDQHYISRQIYEGHQTSLIAGVELTGGWTGRKETGETFVVTNLTEYAKSINVKVGNFQKSKRENKFVMGYKATLITS